MRSTRLRRRALLSLATPPLENLPLGILSLLLLSGALALPAQAELIPCQVCTDTTPCSTACFDWNNYNVISTCGDFSGICGDPEPPPPAVILEATPRCAWGDRSCNPCVVDVDLSMSSLRDHGDIMGYDMNGAEDVSSSSHWQGVQRLPADGGRFMAVSRSGSAHDTVLVLVHLETRNTTGMRLRSNRISPWSYFYQIGPSFEDRIVAEVAEPGFEHGGGIQAIGNILAVPLEKSGDSRVVFYDVADPTNPIRLYHFDHSDPTNSSDPSAASSVGIVKLLDGRYLMAVGGKDTKKVDFYVSTTTDLTDTSTQFDLFYTRTQGFDQHFQSLNLVAQCDGKIFLVGAYNTKWSGNGDDWVYWFELKNGAGNSVLVTEKGKKHMYCGYSVGGQRHCNLQAAAGIYIGSDGQLLFYSTEHDNDGPGPLGSVKFEEFRPTRPGDCPTINDAWVDYYIDPNFKGRGVILDYRDRWLRQYWNYYKVEKLEDKISSAKWCIPPGWRLRLWEHKSPCGGSYRDLTGSGEEDHFSHISFDDKVSCSEWLNY